MARWPVAPRWTTLGVTLAVLPTAALAGTPCVAEVDLCPPPTACIAVGAGWECRPLCENEPGMSKARVGAALEAAIEENRIDSEGAWGDAGAWLRLRQTVERHLGCSLAWPGPPRALP